MLSNALGSAAALLLIWGGMAFTNDVVKAAKGQIISTLPEFFAIAAGTIILIWR